MLMKKVWHVIEHFVCKSFKLSNWNDCSTVVVDRYHRKRGFGSVLCTFYVLTGDDPLPKIRCINVTDRFRFFFLFSVNMLVGTVWIVELPVRVRRRIIAWLNIVSIIIMIHKFPRMWKSRQKKFLLAFKLAWRLTGNWRHVIAMTTEWEKNVFGFEISTNFTHALSTENPFFCRSEWEENRGRFFSCSGTF